MPANGIMHFLYRTFDSDITGQRAALQFVCAVYHYTDKLGAKFLGLVPYLIPAAVGGLVMTAWDVVMDPIMVAGGHWVWDVNGAYHGIPLQNF